MITETLRKIWITGGTPTPSQITADIRTIPELDGYRDGLRLRGALTDDAIAAIAARRAELMRGR